MKSACGCCEGIGPVTPLVTANRPGLDKLVSRAGTYSTFLETMLARLSNLCLGDAVRCSSGEGIYPLLGLKTRDQGDPAIAMLHAFATVADVLTFYQERIANEGYLRTATERLSVMELARLVGYRLRPGVSASVYLAFDLDKEYVGDIPEGTRAQSTPDPGELPQFFETGESILGKGIWNAISPRMSVPHWITIANIGSIQDLYFDGTHTDLKPNDPLVVVFEDSKLKAYIPRIFTIQQVLTDNEAGRTQVKTASSVRVAAKVEVREDLVGNLKKSVEQYLDTDAFNISSTTKMAGRILGQLKALKAGMVSETSVSALHRLVTEVLPPLKEEARLADEGGYAKLKPWVDGLVTTLEDHEKRLKHAALQEPASMSSTEAAAVAPPDADLERCFCPGSATPVYLENLFDLVTPLTQPPAEVPYHATALVRSPAEVFDSKADTVPQLLKAFNWRLEDKLFRAWKKAAVPPARPVMYPFDSVQSFRGKAAPFGHNAPKDIIYNDKGVIIGHEEWPLTSANLGVTLRGDTNATILSLPITLELSLDTRDHAFQETRTITKDDLKEPDPVGNSVTEFSLRFGLSDYSAEIVFEALFAESESVLPVSLAITYPSLDSNASATFGFPLNRDDNSMRFSISGHSGAIPPGESVEFRDPILHQRVYLTYDTDIQYLSLALMLAPTALVEEVKAEMNAVVYLDADYQGIEPNSWVVIARADKDIMVARQVEAVKTLSLAAYGISGKSTQLILKPLPGGEWLTSDDTSLAALRNTTVYFQKGDPAALTEIPLSDTVAGNRVELDDLYEDLNAGRWVTVSGERMDTGIEDSELMMLASVEHGPHRVAFGPKWEMYFDLPNDTSHTTLHFAGEGLVNQYKRETVKISANVAKATHGETREAILGSGDASQVYQHFSLKQSPLTYLAAPTPAGAEDTLEVRVNRVRWHEKETLCDLGPQDRSYITRIDNEEIATIIFGNGEQAARPPTGSENIKAVYRFGMGRIGNVAAGKISQLATKPLGLMGVINPLQASGGADRETRDQARDNAPMAVMSLDRLVSIQDYADFTRTFAGIGKASAALLSDGRREVVHVTIAGADDAPIEPTSDLYRNLRAALSKYGDPYQPIQIASRKLATLILEAGVRIHPDYLFKDVQPEIVSALLSEFGFQKRALGQDALLGEIMAALHTVPGVTYVDIDKFDCFKEENVADAKSLNTKLSQLQGQGQEIPERPLPRVQADLARYDGSVIQAAELAIFTEDLSESHITLKEITG